MYRGGRPHRKPISSVAVVALLVVCIVPWSTGASAARSKKASFEPHVVVATIDTGTNPFHPAWRRAETRHPSQLIPGYPRGAEALNLTLDGSFAENVAASQRELAKLKEGRFPYWVPGTNIVGLWAAKDDPIPVFDPTTAEAPERYHSHEHGASASSQIAARGFGMAPEAYLVVLDYNFDVGASTLVLTNDRAYALEARALRWAADRSWIDIIHTNIQNPVPMANGQTPAYPGYPEAVRYALDRGKVVISAAGNFYAEPSETSPHTGPSGVLVAGANDNCGYADYSNPNPHVVMDGYATVAANPNGEGETRFSGTSSSSPRITGYVAELLLRIRRHYDYPGGIQGDALVSVPPPARPAEGPLADGALTAAELHEVVRKTASAASHDSRWDGEQGLFGVGCIPEPPLPFSFYPKTGYGEVSEHTIGHAVRVVTGAQPLPERSVEDAFYEASESLRAKLWD